MCCDSFLELVYTLEYTFVLFQCSLGSILVVNIWFMFKEEKNENAEKYTDNIGIWNIHGLFFLEFAQLFLCFIVFSGVAHQTMNIQIHSLFAFYLPFPTRSLNVSNLNQLSLYFLINTKLPSRCLIWLIRIRKGQYKVNISRNSLKFNRIKLACQVVKSFFNLQLKQIQVK